MILGINGKIGSGKDTIGNIIQYLTDDLNKNNPKEFTEWVDGGFHASDWKVKKFAGKLKEIAALLTGCTIEQLEDQEFKKQLLGFDWRSGHCVGASSTYRELLQLLGTEIMRDKVHPNVWVNALFADYHATLNKSMDESFNEQFLTGRSKIHYKIPNWIITDMRFPNEMDAVKAKGGITIRVNRPYSTTGGNGIPATFSQTQFHPSETALDDHEFDYVIDNNGSISDLIDKVKEILTLNNII